MDQHWEKKLPPTAAPGGSASVSRNATRPARVLDVTRQCVALFGRACSSRTLDAGAKADIENQLGRFKIWAGTIGVFAAGNASTDARLKNDEDVKEIMMDMLLRLRKALDGFLRPVIVEESEGEDAPESSDSSDDSEASLILSIGDASDAATVEDKTLNHRLASLQEIDDVISRLYRLSAIIRKPTSLHESVRVASFVAKVEDDPDASEFESHVRWQIRFRLPDASERIVDRLASAVIFRRRKLRYRERHQKKLSQGLDAAFQAEIMLPMTPKAPQRSKTQTQRQGSPILKSAATVKSSSSTAPLSETQASTVNRRGLASYPKSLAGGSNVTKSAVARRNQLDVPPPPQATETTEALCPYCFEVVDKVKMARLMWIRHILKDIDPYVCLFECCSRPNEQFQSLDDWVTHMKWQHTLVWSCQAPGHTHLKFDTSAECEAHMRREHGEDFSSAQLALLVEKSAQPAADPLEVITRYENVESGNRSVCPFCPFSVDKTGVPEPSSLFPSAKLLMHGTKEMRDHIAGHLESIALLSLPEQENLENADSNELQSESAKNSTHSQDQDRDPLFLTSDAWDEYNLACKKEYNGEDYGEKEYDVEPINAAIGISKRLPNKDWLYVTSTIHRRTPRLDPGQDPVLIPFVERARRIQVLEMQKRLKVPLLVVSDPIGLEVPEEQWSWYEPDDDSDWSTVSDDSITKEDVRDIPTIVLEDTEPESATASDNDVVS